MLRNGCSFFRNSSKIKTRKVKSKEKVGIEKSNSRLATKSVCSFTINTLVKKKSAPAMVPIIFWGKLPPFWMRE